MHLINNFLPFGKFKKSLHIFIGEDAAVVVYIDKKIQTKLFVKSTELKDTQKLIQLLDNNQYSLIKIYLSSKNQFCNLRKIAGINFSSAYTLATSQLNLNKNSDFLTTFQFLCKYQSDWLFSFISHLVNPTLIDWFSFLAPYKSIISDIYLAPVELTTLLAKLKNNQDKSKNNALLKKVSTVFNIPQTIQSIEILIFWCRTGGMLATVFINGRIFSSNIFNQINDSDPNIIAGNIEQEISNSSDKFFKAELNYHPDQISIYIILPNVITQCIRLAKIKYQKIYISTPYEAASILNVKSVSSPQDKYFEHIFLAFKALNSGNIKALHHPEIKKAQTSLLINKCINTIALTIMFILIVLIACNLLQTADNLISSAALDKKYVSLTNQLSAEQQSINNITNKSKDYAIEKINEIVELYKIIEVNNNPINAILKLSESLPKQLRISKLAYKANNFDILTNKSSTIINIEMFWTVKDQSNLQLQQIRNDLAESLEYKFPDSEVTLDEFISNVLDNKINLSIETTSILNHNFIDKTFDSVKTNADK